MHVNEDKKACQSKKHGVTFGFIVINLYMKIANIVIV